jgi:hypothetical protein
MSNLVVSYLLTPLASTMILKRPVESRARLLQPSSSHRFRFFWYHITSTSLLSQLEVDPLDAFYNRRILRRA